ncbi:HNH endonuclease [Halobellus inordinatus]|uniref:HNH endonuclease n=1 Tax=Halobellus inordinatus TaxID=1126236 RepID=UPI0034E0956B
MLPWSEFEEPRGDIDNGILLCYTHHRAFDLELFTITEAHEVVTRPDVSGLGSFLEQTLVDTDSVAFPEEPPSQEYLRRRNERLEWWPPDE